MDTPAKNVALFLHPEPPRDTSMVDDLFVNREAEMALAKDKVRAMLQAAETGQASSELIMAVGGLARVGKSHFMLRLLKEVEPFFSLVHRQRVPQGITDPVQVMSQIARELTKKFDEYVRVNSLGSEESPALAAFDETWRLYGEAIQGRSMAISDQYVIQRGHQLSTQLKAFGKLSGLLSRLFEAGGEVALGVQDTDGEQKTFIKTVQIPPFTTQDLCDLIALGYDSIRRAQYDKDSTPFTLLVVLDDFDLLTRDGGALDPLPLLRGLYALAQIDGLYVLTTVREDTLDNNEKNFLQVAYIEPFQDPERLLEIYRKRVQHLMAGDDPFEENFVQQAARSCEGRPGVFIRFLERAFNRTPRSVKKLEFDDYMRRTWNGLERQLSKDFSQQIVKGVTEQGGILPAEVSRRWRSTSAMQFLYEDYSSGEELTVDPILASFLRRQEGAGVR